MPLHISKDEIAARMAMSMNNSSLSNLFEPFQYRPPDNVDPNATHTQNTFIRPQLGAVNHFLSTPQPAQQHQTHADRHGAGAGAGAAPHLQPQGGAPGRISLQQSRDFNNEIDGSAHLAHMRGVLQGSAAGQMMPPTTLSQSGLAIGNSNGAHPTQNNGLAMLQSPSQSFQSEFTALDAEPIGPVSFSTTSEEAGMKIVPDAPNLEYWRNRLFNVDEMITLSEEEFQTYFPHVDNVYSHRSTQRYKSRPFVSHYWDCRLRGRPPGTPKSDNPEKKKRKRTARERDLCHVKIKVVEYFPQAESNTNIMPVNSTPAPPPAPTTVPGIFTWALDNPESTRKTSGQAFQTITPSHSLPPNHPGANGARYYTIQRVNGNGANGKNDGVAGGHRHTLEESDRVKKNSVQRYLNRETKDKRHKMEQVMSSGQNQKSYHTKATGLAAETVDKHSAESNLKLYGSCFCPFVQRVWIALEVKGIPYQYIEVDPYQKPDSLLEVNPRGLVPALRHDDWGCYESNVLLEYLEDLNTGTALLPRDAKLRAHCRLWADHINRHIVPNFYRVLQEQNQQTQIQKAQDLRSSIDQLLEAAHPKGPFFMGAQMNLVDVQAAPWIIRLKRVMKAYRQWPDAEEGSRLAAWVDAIENDQHVQATTSTDELYLDSYQRYAQNRPNTSQVANAINSGEGLP